MTRIGSIMLWLPFAAGCGGGATATANSDEDSGSVVDSSVVDGGSLDTSAPPDTTVVDSSAPDTFDAAAPDTREASAPIDTGPVVDDGTGTFACGTETCGKKFQFCRRATSPGTCPPADSGVCPAGCPGCEPLPLKCEPLPTECFAFPSCACILTKICGSSSAGTCTDDKSGFTAGCMGV